LRQNVLALCVLLLWSSAAAAQRGPITSRVLSDPPRLIVIVVIDQFRADFLSRFKGRFLPAQLPNGKVGGFSYLMKRGAYFPHAEYKVLQAMTAPGHATIATGAYAYRHGVPLNSWFSHAKGAREYCVQSDAYSLIGTKGGSGGPYSGTAPVALVGTTLGDALKNSGRQSRVVTVAIKNRAAILMGGYRADMAIWLEEKSFQWVTSSFYAKDGKLPAWVSGQNAAIQKLLGSEYVWTAKGKGSGLSDDGPAQFTRRFKVGSFDTIRSPLSAEMTIDAALAALKHYKLGSGKHSDLLAVSLSGHDFLGHQIGPNRREMEEMTVAEDRAISRLLNALDLKTTVVAFTGDHGIPPAPSYLKSRGVPAQHMNHKGIAKKLNQHLNRRFGKSAGGPWIQYATNFNFYLNHKTIAAKSLSRGAVESEVKAQLLALPGILYALTADEHARGVLPPGLFGIQAANSYFPGRSGDVVAIPRPFHIKAGTSKASHLSGYTYDRTVPLIIAGPHIRAGVYASPAEIIDLAPTLSFMLGVVAPSLSEGRVLDEIFIR
jgi:predicted AlkP superfamily pyrophosphatase or phosphodiesterase